MNLKAMKIQEKPGKGKAFHNGRQKRPFIDGLCQDDMIASSYANETKVRPSPMKLLPDFFRFSSQIPFPKEEKL